MWYLGEVEWARSGEGVSRGDALVQNDYNALARKRAHKRLTGNRRVAPLAAWPGPVPEDKDGDFVVEQPLAMGEPLTEFPSLLLVLLAPSQRPLLDARVAEVLVSDVIEGLLPALFRSPTHTLALNGLFQAVVLGDDSAEMLQAAAGAETTSARRSSQLFP